MTELLETDETLLQWWSEQGLQDFEKKVKNFHYWLRKHTDLSPGVKVSYVKHLYAMLQETQGDITQVDKDGLEGVQLSAYNKYAEYLENKPNLTLKPTGDEK